MSVGRRVAASRNRLPLFDGVAAPTDCKGYIACRDHPNKVDVRRALERIWRLHGHLVAEKPEQFVKQFRLNFHARAWELYVLRHLVHSRVKLDRAPGKGPDFKGNLPGVGTFWVECVVPEHGEGEDAPRRYSRERGSSVGALGPDGPVLLRYANAISGKIAKVEAYRKAGIVGAKEPVLIALNQGAIDMSDMHDADFPLIARVVFGIGEPALLLKPYTCEQRVVVPPMPTVSKVSGSKVPTRIFLEPGGAVVAGVIFAASNVYNLLPTRGRRLRLVHNPKATVPFPVGAIPLRGEAWANGTRIEHAGIFASVGLYSRKRPWPKRSTS